MSREGLLLGFDVGSSSIKAALLDAATGRLVASATSPEVELGISAPKPGWAEQDPDIWWQHVVRSAGALRAKAGKRWGDVRAIGLSYQMHGLVALDRAGEPVRPAIIWCDSRAVQTGEAAFEALGRSVCLRRLLNSPGNFTASRLAWVKANEPAVFARIHSVMLPGDYVAFRMTGEIRTTVSGLSEFILWDFEREEPAGFVLEHFGIPRAMLPETVPTFAPQGVLTAAAGSALGLAAGVPVSYRAGDQPNNAFSLAVLSPGEIAATAGTSGVVYGVAGTAAFDEFSRVNSFAHVTHAPDRPRIGVLLCVSGTGILYRWLRDVLGGTAGYEELNAVAARAPAGADGLRVFPFGNGAERTLGNGNPGASIRGLDFNRHGLPHLLRAAQEGIVFALRYGLGIMRGMGVVPVTARVGQANLFLSPLFASTFATVTGCRVEMYATDGAQGAARGAGIGAGIYADPGEAFIGLAAVKTVEPDSALVEVYAEACGLWTEMLERALSERLTG
ncbi:MAG: carbohydrate kinase [Spirochaetes bacterium RBG_13_68_11]|nr:MAG: carbohydrate kinase [Spirochaetes bacterium RBG_13_68_11]